MKPAVTPPRRPYWTLPAFAVLIVLPFAWAVAAMAATAVAATAVMAWRWAAAGRPAGVSAAADAVLLGVDDRGRPVHLSDRQLAAHGLILGASGAGKSTTLLGILCHQIRRGRPVVAIDLKGSPAFARELRQAAELAGRPFRLWTPDGPSHWNPLAHGNATSLKDKLIATERFTEPHYQRAAERYVQTAIQVLHAARPERGAQLHEVVELMEPRRLSGLLRHLDGPLSDRVQDYLSGLTPDQLSAIRGLGTRLAIVSESHAGPYLAPAAQAGDATIDLRATLEGSDVVLFSLNSSVYGQLGAQLGTLVIQDLVSQVGHRLSLTDDRVQPPVQAMIAIDEFSALGTDNLLALLARGREAGASVLLATQELADLDRAARGFRDQVLGITSVKLAHRQDVPASAQMIAQMIGTEQVWEETRTIQGPFGRGGRRGTRRPVERFIVHPNEIKSLQTGQAVMITKTPVARATRLRVLPLRRGSPAIDRSAGSPATESAPGRPRVDRPGRSPREPEAGR